MIRNDKEESILENVDQVEVEGDEIRMVNIFGEQKILKAKIRRYSSSESNILLEALD